MCSTSFSERDKRSSFQTTTVSPSRSAPAYGAARADPNGQGEIRDRIFENESFRGSGLSLIAAAIVRWNTVYLDRAVQHLRALGFRRGRSHDFLKIARYRFIPMALAFRSDFERGF